MIDCCPPRVATRARGSRRPRAHTAGSSRSTAAPASAAPVVGGAPMLPTKTIVENASAASNLTTLVSAVKAAGLVATLSGPGPFTVFAPTNDAFGRLAPGTLDTLLKPANKATLTKVLTYHVIAGKLTLADLQAKVQAGGGTATLTTVAGQPLTVTYANNVVTLTDPAGNKSYVETPDVLQSNGVVHVVNGVLVPKLQ
ncbi:fasciclin domain-containing protein [Sphingomonas bacterium]|uniref:fasciclin domain-containing protein n=1 Tax=Sphingomonas bacterium TaxID=1895847 RepID=UPI003F68B7B6